MLHQPVFLISGARSAIDMDITGNPIESGGDGSRVDVPGRLYALYLRLAYSKARNTTTEVPNLDAEGEYCVTVTDGK